MIIPPTLINYLFKQPKNAATKIVTIFISKLSRAENEKSWWDLLCDCLKSLLTKDGENENNVKKISVFYSMMKIMQPEDLNHVEEKNLENFHHYFAL